MSQILPVTSGEVPESLECIITNTRWQQLIQLLSVIVPTGFKLTISATAPAPEDRDGLWLKLDSSTGYPVRIYYYTGGYWLSRHPDFVGKVIMWEGDISLVNTLDEGEDGIPIGTATAITGPFWKEVTEMQGRIPIGPGQIDAGPPIVNATVNVNAGSYDVTLDSANFQRHRHWLLANATANGGSTPTSTQQIAHDGGGYGNENYLLQASGTVATEARSSFVIDGSQTDPNEAFPILPQVRGIYFLRKTAREFYRENA